MQRPEHKQARQAGKPQNYTNRSPLLSCLNACLLSTAWSLRNFDVRVWERGGELELSSGLELGLEARSPLCLIMHPSRGLRAVVEG